MRVLGSSGGYTPGRRAWGEFCADTNTPLLLPMAWSEYRRETALIEFVLYMVVVRPRRGTGGITKEYRAQSANVGVTPVTAGQYLSAVRDWHLQHGCEKAFVRGLRTRQCLRTLTRYYGPAARQPRRPFTIDLLRRIRQAGAVDLTRPAGRRLWAQLLFGFFTTSRSAEYTGGRLLIGDVALDTTAAVPFITVRYGRTKTDAPGTTRSIGMTFDAAICPVQALVAMLGDRGVSTGALFANADGSPVTYRQFKREMAAVVKSVGEEPSAYTCHSLRYGGASAMLSAGYSADVIKIMGRWRSDAWLIYAHLAQDFQASVASTLVRASATVSPAETKTNPTKQLATSGDRCGQ